MKIADVPASWSEEAANFFTSKSVHRLMGSKHPERDLYVSSSRDYLRKRTFFERLCSCSSSLCQQEEEALRGHIKSLVKELERCPELQAAGFQPPSMWSEDLRIFVEKVQKLFFEHLSKLSDESFDRHALCQGQHPLFTADGLSKKTVMDPSQALRFVLQPDLREAYQAHLDLKANLPTLKTKAEGDPLVESQVSLLMDSHLLALAREERRLAQRVGLRSISAGKGSTGTRLDCGLGGLLGVTKFPAVSYSAMRSIENRFGQRSHLNVGENAQVEGEVFAYRVWQMARLEEVGIHVPPSDLDRYQGEHRLQMLSLFLHLKEQLALDQAEADIRAKTVEAVAPEAQALLQDKSCDVWDEAALTRMQVFGGFDYYLFNFDRHGENWSIFSSKGWNAEERHVDAIACIDSANSVPEDHGRKPWLVEFPRHKLLLQKHLPFANQPLTEQARRLYLRLAQQSEQHIANALFEVPDYLNDKMIKLLRLRAQVMMKAATDKDMTFAKLANLDTTAEMEVYVGGWL